MPEMVVTPDGREMTVAEYEALSQAARDMAAEYEAAEEARQAEEQHLLDVIAYAEGLRHDLAVMAMTPVANRDPAAVTALMGEGADLLAATYGMDDPRIVALRSECVGFSVGALAQRVHSP